MELRKPDNYYGACLATEPPLPFRLSGGGVQVTNTYFRQQPVNQRRDSDCSQYLKSDIVICKNSFDRIVNDRFIERVFAN
jgi:hypothetical protein